MFNVLTVRDGTEDDGRLYPLLSPGPYPVKVDELDGDRIELLGGDGLALQEVSTDGRNLKRLTLLKETKVKVLVTDARVVVTVNEWNRGDRYWGVGLGATVALAQNVGNRIKESRERAGSKLAGHIRFPWLTSVGFSAPSFTRGGQIRFGVAHRLPPDGTIRRLYLDIAMKRSVDTSQLTHTIISRAVSYRLRHEEFDDAKRQVFEALPKSIGSASRQAFTTITFPTSHPAMAETALP